MLIFMGTHDSNAASSSAKNSPSTSKVNSYNNYADGLILVSTRPKEDKDTSRYLSINEIKDNLKSTEYEDPKLITSFDQFIAVIFSEKYENNDNKFILQIKYALTNFVHRGPTGINIGNPDGYTKEEVLRWVFFSDNFDFDKIINSNLPQNIKGFIIMCKMNIIMTLSIRLFKDTNPRTINPYNGGKLFSKSRNLKGIIKETNDELNKIINNSADLNYIYYDSEKNCYYYWFKNWSAGYGKYLEDCFPDFEENADFKVKFGKRKYIYYDIDSFKKFKKLMAKDINWSKKERNPFSEQDLLSKSLLIELARDNSKSLGNLKKSIKDSSSNPIKFGLRPFTISPKIETEGIQAEEFKFTIKKSEKALNSTTIKEEGKVKNRKHTDGNPLVILEAGDNISEFTYKADIIEQAKEKANKRISDELESGKTFEKLKEEIDREFNELKNSRPEPDNSDTSETGSQDGSVIKEPTKFGPRITFQSIERPKPEILEPDSIFGANSGASSSNLGDPSGKSLPKVANLADPITQRSGSGSNLGGPKSTDLPTPTPPTDPMPIGGAFDKAENAGVGTGGNAGVRAAENAEVRAAENAKVRAAENAGVERSSSNLREPLQEDAPTGMWGSVFSSVNRMLARKPVNPPNTSELGSARSIPPNTSESGSARSISRSPSKSNIPKPEELSSSVNQPPREESNDPVIEGLRFGRQIIDQPIKRPKPKILEPGSIFGANSGASSSNLGDPSGKSLPKVANLADPITGSPSGSNLESEKGPSVPIQRPGSGSNLDRPESTGAPTPTPPTGAPTSKPPTDTIISI